MKRTSGCAVLLALTAAACSGAPGPDGELGTGRAAVVPACQTEPATCSNAPFAEGAWIGDTGPFASLVLSDSLCGDLGYCFAGHLSDGTRVDGQYFERPELVRFHWPDTGMLFQGYGVQGDTLTLYNGPEGHIVPVATLHRAASYCDAPADCALQSVPPAPCRSAQTTCTNHVCGSTCAPNALVLPRRPALAATRTPVLPR